MYDYGLGTVMGYAVSISFRKFFKFFPMFAIQALSSLWMMNTVAQKAVEIVKEKAGNLTVENLVGQTVFSGHVLLLLLATLVITLIFSLYITLEMRDDLLNGKTGFAQKTAYIAKHVWSFIGAGIVLILALFAGIIIYVLIVMLFSFFLLFAILLALAGGIAIFYFLSVYVYVPYTAFLTGSSTGAFATTKEYMTGHIGGSFLFLFIFGIIMDRFSSLVSKEFVHYYYPLNAVAPAAWVVIVLSVLYTAIEFYYNLVIIAYITHGYAGTETPNTNTDVQGGYETKQIFYD